MKLLSVLLFSCFAGIVVAASNEAITRIANKGETASESEFPYQVSIRADGQHFCGGALISKSHVLTAAHCVQQGVDMGDFAKMIITVEVGSTHLRNGTSYNVKRISYHKGFSENTPYFLPNDIAVIHLEKPVETSDKVAVIGLPEANSELPDGAEVIVSGFGSDVAVKGSISPILKKMDAKIVSTAKCQNNFRQIIQSQKMCAAKAIGYGTCTGDSGGPLVDSDKKTVVGVISGGDGECSSGSPDVYTKVSHFIPYIKEELEYDSKNSTSGNKNPAIDYDTSSNEKPKKGAALYPKPKQPLLPPKSNLQLPQYPLRPYPQLPLFSTIQQPIYTQNYYPVLSRYPLHFYPIYSRYPFFLRPIGKK